MFKKLFTRPTVLSRHIEAPLAKERSGYLDQLADQGWCHRVIRQTAAYLLVITDMLRLGDHPDRIISVSQIEEAATHWATRREKRKNYKPGRNNPSVPLVLTFSTCEVRIEGHCLSALYGYLVEHAVESIQENDAKYEKPDDNQPFIRRIEIKPVSQETSLIVVGLNPEREPLEELP
jgi:hypothetical protein